MRSFKNLIILVTVFITLQINATEPLAKEIGLKDIAVKKIELNTVSAINVSHGIKVIYTKTPPKNSNKSFLTITAPAEKIPFVKVEKQKDSSSTWNITYNNENNFSTKDDIIVNISAPVIDYFSLSTGAILESENLNYGKQVITIVLKTGSSAIINGIICGGLNINCTTGSKIDANDIKVIEVKADATTGSNIKLSGSSLVASLTANSGSSIVASQLKVRNGTVTAKTGSSISCYITEEIKQSTDISSKIQNINN